MSTKFDSPKEIIRRAGLLIGNTSQTAVADHIKESLSTVNGWLKRGISKRGIKKLTVLAGEFGASTEWLFFGEQQIEGDAPMDDELKQYFIGELKRKNTELDEYKQKVLDLEGRLAELSKKANPCSGQSKEVNGGKL